MGRGVAEHVETNPAASTLVSRRQSPPVAPLLAILVAADQGSNGVGTHPSLRALQGSSSLLTNRSPLIGFAKDGFPIYGHWFVNSQGKLVKAQSGYVLKTYDLNEGNSRDPVLGLPPNFDRGTPPTPWDIANRSEDFDSDVGIPLGRYLDDWVYDDGNTGNLDECNGAIDINGVYGYYITHTYPYAPICTFGVHEPSFGKVPPLRWHNETTENTHDDHGHKINGH